MMNRRNRGLDSSGRITRGRSSQIGKLEPCSTRPVTDLEHSRPEEHGDATSITACSWPLACGRGVRFQIDFMEIEGAPVQEPCQSRESSELEQDKYRAGLYQCWLKGGLTDTAVIAIGLLGEEMFAAFLI